MQTTAVFFVPNTYLYFRREGQEMLLNDSRPNDELLLATGALQVCAVQWVRYTVLNKS